MQNRHDMTTFVAGAIVTHAILHTLRGAPFRAIGEGVDVGLLLGGPQYGPPAPRRWDDPRDVDWVAILGGPPLEVDKGEW